MALGEDCADEAEDHAGSDHCDGETDERETESDEISHNNVSEL